MKYLTCFSKLFRPQLLSMILIMISFSSMTNLNGISVPDEPLTLPLPARKGTKIVTSDWLLNQPKQSTDYPIVRWLDTTHLLFASPPKQSTEEWTIELYNLLNNEHKVLGQGTNPIPSPDSQWIAFTQGKKEEKQLWIMDSSGKNVKQLTHIKSGLGDYFQHDFDFAWSPDSKKISLSHQPYVPYWEKKATTSKHN